MEIQDKRQIFLVTNSLPCTEKLLAGPCLWAVALLEPASSGTGLQPWSKSGFCSQLPLSVLVLLGAQSLGSQELTLRTLVGTHTALPKLTLCQKVAHIPPSCER